MNAPGKLARCAIYTRKSTDHNLDLAVSDPKSELYPVVGPREVAALVWAPCPTS